MRRISIVVATLLLGSGLITGCGSSDDDGGGGGNSSSAYCSAMKASAAGLKSLNGGTPDFTKLSEFIDKAHDLADKAPSDIKDDWTVLVGAMDALTSALSDAGLKLEDLGLLMSGQIPDGVDTTKLAGLTSQLQGIASDKVTKASAAIRKQAKDDCGVDLDKVA